MHLASKPATKRKGRAKGLYIQSLWAMLALPAPPSSLIPPSSPFFLLLLSAKSFAPDYARCKFDGSGLCWRFRPLAPPPSLLPSSSCPLPPPSSTLNKPLCAAYAALCVPPMRGTRFYLDLDRAPCFETILAHRGLCANPMRGHIHQRK